MNRAFTVSDAPVAVPVTGFSCCAEGCAVDCELGEWGEWGECTGDCDTGSQPRTRAVVVEPSGGGAACGPLTDTQSCELLPCYMTSFRFLTIPSQPEIGVTVMNQSYTGGQPIITHSGDNRWRFTLGAYPGTRHGTIRLEDDPSWHLQVNNANDVILGSGGGPGSVFRVVPGSAAGTVRIMVSGPVNCGGHSAQICEHCPSGNGAAWCSGDCTWNEAEQACRGDTGEGLRFLGGADNNLSGRQVTVTRAPADSNW